MRKTGAEMKTDSKKSLKARRGELNLDCAVCVHRRSCERAEEDTFCGQFRSREFDPATRGVDPNELWEKGGEVEF